MSIKRIDSKGRVVSSKGKPKTRLAEKVINGVPHYHYEIYVAISQDKGKKTQIRKRYWLPDDLTAEEKERELRREGPVNALTWRGAHARWLRGNDFTESHANDSTLTIDLWEKDFGVNSTIEGTTLAMFSHWVSTYAKKGTGRSAQNRRAHLLAISRWVRARGMVKTIPFEHAPKPPARMKKVKPAEVDVYLAYLEALPVSMRPLWRLLGHTGMRISAACNLKEQDIGESSFTVTTKFNKKVTYQITPALREILDDALRFKAAGYMKGRGKDKVRVEITAPNIFINDRGTPWTKDTVNHKLEAVRKASGGALPKVTPHQLRHMVGTMLAENNYSPDMIQAGLGHDSRASAETYIDQTQKMRNEALAAVAGTLENVEKLYISDPKNGKNEPKAHLKNSADNSSEKVVTCPECGCNFIPNK